MPTDKRTVTPRRRAANRAAAAQSTGPRTQEGKARSAQNSLRHGAFAQQPAIRHKAIERLGATARYEQLRQSLVSDWQPATPQQQELVDSLAWLTFLRDEARQAFLDSHELSMVPHAIIRERKRWQERHHAPPASDDMCIEAGLPCLDTTQDKLDRLAVVLADLRATVEQAAWKQKLPGLSEHPERLRLLLCGEAPRTARLRKLDTLLAMAPSQKIKPGDATSTQILALLGEEEQVLAEERQLFEREQAVEREQAEALEEAQERSIFPLNEPMAELLRQMEALEKQINAKIRLLLRLERRAAEGGAVAAVYDRRKTGAHRAPLQKALPADERAIDQNNGTKPTEPLESAELAELIESDRRKVAEFRRQLGIDKPVTTGMAIVTREDEPCEL